MTNIEYCARVVIPLKEPFGNDTPCCTYVSLVNIVCVTWS